MSGNDKVNETELKLSLMNIAYAIAPDQRVDFNSTADAIDHLRTLVKATMLDLEATRRECGYLRKMLDELSKE